MDAELLKPEHYRNRELSWIQFNYRVLEEARDKTLPLFERLKFLSITASNLDEFFMVRVASLKDMVHAKYKKPDIAGLKPEEQLEKISKELHEFVELQYSTYNRSLLPLLEQEDVTIITSHKKLNKEQKKFVDDYFMKNVYPVLTPMAVDSSRPFPLIRNKTLNIASLIRKKGEADAELDFATVQVPSVLPRIVKVPSENGITIILLEQIIERNIHKLYLNYDVVCAHPYRIERNADLSIEEEEAADLLKQTDLIGIPFTSEVPLAPLHFMIADRESVLVAEPEAEGLKLYVNPFGVLTNNPPFPFHVINMQQYINLTPKSPENRFASGLQLKPFGQGMGAIGLPGDASPASRFVRSAFLKWNASAPKEEKASVSQFFHILDGVAMVRGMVITEEGRADITTYSCCANTCTGVYYYKTYDNHRIQAVDMHRENLDGSQLISYGLSNEEDIRVVNA